MFGGAPVLEECETIPLRERAGEYLMLRLRTRLGIESGEYRRMFRMDFAPLEELLEKLRAARYAVKEDGRWRADAPGGSSSPTRSSSPWQEAQREASATWMDPDGL